MSNRGLIDHLKQVKQHKKEGYWESLDSKERKEWSSWMIHRFLSMSTDYLPIVNEVQSTLIGLDDRLVYTFWKNALPSDPRFHNYIKADAKSGGTPDWLLDLVCEHFSVSNREARDYIEIFMNGREDDLRDLAHGYGIQDDKRSELEDFIENYGRS
jgi:hypothetical protein